MLQMQELHGDWACEISQALLDWAGRNELRVRWGEGAERASFFLHLDHAGYGHYLLSPWAGFKCPQVQLQFGKFSDLQQAEIPELIRRLNEIPGATISGEKAHLYPSIQYTDLKSDAALQQLFSAFEWAVERWRQK